MIIVSTEHLPLVKEILQSSPILAVDTETTGLKWYKEDRLFSIIISNEKDDYYFNFKDYGDGSPIVDKQKTVELLSYIFKDYLKTYFLQNAKFDMHMLAREGIYIKGKIYDLMFLDRIHNNQHLSYRLAEITKRWGEFKDDRVEQYILENKLVSFKEYPSLNKSEEFKHFDRVPFKLISEYGCQDGRATFNTGIKIIKELQKMDDELNHPAKQMAVVENEAKLVHTLFEMEESGILVDIEYCWEALEYYQEIMKVKEKEFFTLTGIEFVKGTTVFEKVFESEKDKWVKTEKGNWRWDSETLEGFTNPAASIAIEYAEAKKQSEYFANFIFYSDKQRFLHSDFAQSGTSTGRMSSRDPNIQNLSRPDKYEDEVDASKYPVRRALIPRKGYFFVMIDYEQQEFRMLLEYAKANGLIREVLGGLDVHAATAKISGTSRKEAKTNNFLCIAEGQKVLTHKGLVNIEDIALEHRLWDGVEWVNHEGIVYKGERECLEYEGLIATSEHEVFTDTGWKIQIGDLSKKPYIGRIMDTEIDGNPIRYFITAREYSEKNWKYKMETSSPRAIFLFKMFKDNVDKLRKYCKKKNHNMQVYDYTSKRICSLQFYSSKKTSGKIFRCCFSLYKSFIEILQELWRKGYRSKMFFKRMENVFSYTVFGKRYFRIGYRSNKQQRPLRDRKYEAYKSFGEFKKQTKKVYDIMNSGPRNRFTVSGKLVSNCAYGGGVVKLAGKLYKTTGSKHQLGAIYKRIFGWRLSEEEKAAEKTVTSELKAHNEPLIKKAYDIQQAIFNSAPEIKIFLKNAQKKAEKVGFVINWLGRRYRFPDKRWCYRAPNSIIQGGSAEVTKIAMNKTADYLRDKESKLILSIHDELVLEVKYGEEYVVDKVVEIMENIYPARLMKLTTDVEYSYTNLADKSSWPPEHLKDGGETRDKIQSEITS